MPFPLQALNAGKRGSSMTCKMLEVELAGQPIEKTHEYPRPHYAGPVHMVTSGRNFPEMLNPASCIWFLQWEAQLGKKAIFF